MATVGVGIALAAVAADVTWAAADTEVAAQRIAVVEAAVTSR